MAGAGGGAWKVAYADFVTAMMAFFMVMWLTTQDKDIKESIAGYFEDPWGTSSEYSSPRFQLPTDVSGDQSGPPVPGHQPSTRAPGTEEKDMGAAGSKDKSRWTQGYRMHVLQEGDRLPPAAVVQFDETTADLSDSGKRQLDGLLPMMIGKSNRVEIRGHSTHRPLPEGGKFTNHWELCYERSQAVMQYLIQHGVEADRIRLSQSGAFEPVTTRFEAAWQRENSRVEVYLLSEVAGKAAQTDPGRQASAGDASFAHSP
jgi:chemotaxis protein MotB